MDLLEILQHTALISLFVAAMMIIVDWLNVLTRGTWQRALQGSPWLQYLAAVLLGAMPGCLGAFVVVSLFLHRSLSLGAVVACMIATSGDEAFVMFALFPEKALLLTLGMVAVGLVAGVSTDLVLSRRRDRRAPGHLLPLHEEGDDCTCFDLGRLPRELSRPTPWRLVLVLTCASFLGAVVSGVVGPPAWSWIRVTLAAVFAATLFIVVTVPDHFLRDHLWGHVVVRHVPRIFLWTFGALTVVALLDQFVIVRDAIHGQPALVMVLASFLGVIPESGPHLLFVTLHQHGTVPLSVLAASSIVQDGHGMLPLLAESWRDFLLVKGINLVAGLAVGVLLLLAGS